MVNIKTVYGEKKSISNDFLEKLQAVCREFYSGSIEKMSISMHVNYSTMRGVLAGNTNVGLHHIVRLISAQPDLSLDWLFRNEGGIRKSNSVMENSSTIFGDVNGINAVSADNAVVENNSTLAAQIAEKDRQINTLHEIILRLSSK